MREVPLQAYAWGRKVALGDRQLVMREEPLYGVEYYMVWESGLRMWVGDSECRDAPRQSCRRL